MGSVVVGVGGLGGYRPASGGGGTAPAITSLNPTTGPVGTAVTITGTNFGTTGTVTFNGTTATTTSWSATSIVASVPSGATTGNVVVTVGGIASNGVNFTVTSSAPAITSLNPTTGPRSEERRVGRANFGTRGTETYNGTTASTTSWSATSIEAAVPGGATTA